MYTRKKLSQLPLNTPLLFVFKRSGHPELKIAAEVTHIPDRPETIEVKMIGIERVSEFLIKLKLFPELIPPNTWFIAAHRRSSTLDEVTKVYLLYLQSATPLDPRDLPLLLCWEKRWPRFEDLLSGNHGKAYYGAGGYMIPHLDFWNSKEGKKFMFTKNRQGINYADAIKMLGNRSSVKLCYETTLRKENDGNVYIRHFLTDIITLRPDGTTILNNGGWYSATTQARLNAFLEVGVWNEKGNWAVKGSDEIMYEYENNMMIDAQGIPSTCPLAVSVLAKILGVEVATEKELGGLVAGLDLEKIESLWKRCWKYRGTLAKHCSEKFLPLTLASKAHRYENTEWRKIVADRLRGVSNVCTV